MTNTQLPKVSQHRARVMGIVFLVFAVAILILFVPSSSGDQVTTFVFGQSETEEQVATGAITFSTTLSPLRDGGGGHILRGVSVSQGL